MNVLNNIVTSVGNYNNIPTSLTSNVSTVSMVEGLMLTMQIRKIGIVVITYTIVIDNKIDTAYENPKITDVIDDSLVEFVNDSVTINGVTATSSQYNYDDASHTLTVNLDSVNPSTTTTLTFRVTQKS